MNSAEHFLMFVNTFESFLTMGIVGWWLGRLGFHMPAACRREHH